MSVGNFSKYVEDAVINWMRGTTFPTAPTNLWVALLTTMPSNKTGTGLVEVTGNSYARQTMALAAPTTVANTEQSANTNTVTFPVAYPGNWGSVYGFAIYDAATSGNLLAFNTFVISPIIVNSGFTVRLNPGTAIVTVD